MRLPVELRLQIYSLLLLPRRATDLLPAYEKVHASTQDYFDYDKKQHGTDHPATADLAHPHLLIRTIDPDRYRTRYPETSPTPLRSQYSVRCDRFRSACKRTTYHCVNTPGLATQLMTVNRTIHAEAADLLYGSYTFDFDTHVEAIVPFLSDLTPFARRCIKGVRLVKRALAYEKEFDRCEWSHALRYLTSPSTGAALRKLELGVVAGRPGAHGWDGVPVYDQHDMALLSGLEGYEWMRDLLAFRGLQEVDVQAVVEHCAPGGTSRALAGYIRFSASVESGFKGFLREQLLGA
ncbi:hypothetical protein Tdes44962_MAKER01406 [Teratosphaeria destructans]|uniref:Uncharacterized protein n=1 Tax=Teratosphaeria destructans TaxID=418781 RepID=A0A9W7T054_9PEZI|nr:hypothetical protein Tdes44962_MAKER01406 [Teratosphaeria destructans]